MARNQIVVKVSQRQLFAALSERQEIPYDEIIAAWHTLGENTKLTLMAIRLHKANPGTTLTSAAESVAAAVYLRDEADNWDPDPGTGQLTSKEKIDLADQIIAGKNKPIYGPPPERT